MDLACHTPEPCAPCFLALSSIAPRLTTTQQHQNTDYPSSHSSNVGSSQQYLTVGSSRYLGPLPSSAQAPPVHCLSGSLIFAGRLLGRSPCVCPFCSKPSTDAWVGFGYSLIGKAGRHWHPWFSPPCSKRFTDACSLPLLFSLYSFDLVGLFALWFQLFLYW